MAMRSNISHGFFLGEDKQIDFAIVGQDGVTPFDLGAVGLTASWVMRTSGAAAALLSKTLGAGLSIVGVYNAVPAVNTQRLRATFAAADTAAGLTANTAYTYSLRRTDAGNVGVLAYGTITFLKD